MYSERQLRNKSFGDVITLPTYDKTWNWNRIYDLKFDLATSLTMSFTANATSFINELPGSNNEIWDGNLYGVDTVYTPEQKKQQVKDEVLRGGTRSKYSQSLNINYNIPINKVPGLDWVTGQTGYQVAYNWNASPISIQNELGNTIANNLNWNINGNADLNKLYNKSNFLKNINNPPKKKNGRNQKQQRDDAGDEADSTKTKPKINYGKIAYETILRVLMSVKKVSFQYSTNQGTSLPGFVPVPQILGNNWLNAVFKLVLWVSHASLLK